MLFYISRKICNVILLVSSLLQCKETYSIFSYHTDHYNSVLQGKHENLYKELEIYSVTLLALEFDMANPFHSNQKTSLSSSCQNWIHSCLKMYGFLLFDQFHGPLMLLEARELHTFHWKSFLLVLDNLLLNSAYFHCYYSIQNLEAFGS